jgi:hypothetical protein
LKVNLATISKRAKGFLENPQFLKSDLLEDFQVTLDSSDKILTVYYRFHSEEVERIFSEGLAIFSKNRNPDELWIINFREFENFLRDENHLPALDLLTPEFEEIFIIIKISLIASIIKLRHGTDLVNTIQTASHWENLSLVEKNIWARDFLVFLGRELIFCDGQTLTVKKAPIGVTEY